MKNLSATLKETLQVCFYIQTLLCKYVTNKSESDKEEENEGQREWEREWMKLWKEKQEES